MIQFQHEIQNTMGIYGNPARLLIEEAANYESTIVICKGNRSVDLIRYNQLVELGIHCGDTITVAISGKDEALASRKLQAYFIQHL